MGVWGKFIHLNAAQIEGLAKLAKKNPDKTFTIEQSMGKGGKTYTSVSLSGGERPCYSLSLKGNTRRLSN